MALKVLGECWEYKSPKGVIGILSGTMAIAIGFLCLPFPFLAFTTNGVPVGIISRLFLALFPLTFLFIGYCMLSCFTQVIVNRQYKKLITKSGLFPFTISTKTIEIGDASAIRLDQIRYRRTTSEGRARYDTRHPVRLVTPSGSKYISKSRSYAEGLQIARNLSVFLGVELLDNTNQNKK